MPCNLAIVVEKNLHNEGLFTRQLLASFSADGRYSQSRLITETGFFSAISLCETGKIDAIIFETSPDDYWELMRFQGLPSPINALINGSQNGGIVELNPQTGEMFAQLFDGQVLDETEMKERTYKGKLATLWMGHIAEACLNAGVCVPSYFVINGPEDTHNIARTVALGLRSISR